MVHNCQLEDNIDKASFHKVKMILETRMDSRINVHQHTRYEEDDHSKACKKRKLDFQIKQS